MKKSSFFGARNQDEDKEEGQQPSTSPLFHTEERFEEKPVDYSNNYLYTDEDVDRWNTPPPVGWQNSGKPRGIVPNDGKEFNSLVKGDGKVFDEDNVIRSLNNQEKIIDHVIKAMNGG